MLCLTSWPCCPSPPSHWPSTTCPSKARLRLDSDSSPSRLSNTSAVDRVHSSSSTYDTDACHPMPWLDGACGISLPTDCIRRAFRWRWNRAWTIAPTSDRDRTSCPRWSILLRRYLGRTSDPRRHRGLRHRPPPRRMIGLRYLSKREGVQRMEVTMRERQTVLTEFIVIAS